ncbi:MAG: hypothetical protein AAB620_02010 [Patescibacteria group bacterium]
MADFNAILQPLYFYLWEIIKAWWWLPAPIILGLLFQKLYRYRVTWDMWYKRIEWMVLEVKPPETLLKPFKAMDDVFGLLWCIYDSASWQERWCEGVLERAPYWLSCEIASIEGQIHYYFFLDRGARSLVESTIYAQYPDAEITEVEDYAKMVPQDLPNKDWNMLGEDYRLAKPDPWPILTYKAFFEEKPDVAMEEKRMDPIDSFMESLAKVPPGSQFWFQMVCAPILNSDYPWKDQGLAIADKIARRPAAPKAMSFGQLFLNSLKMLATGKTITDPLAKPEKALPLTKTDEGEREMLITPGEKFDLHAVEDKISKKAFLVWSRALYVYKRDSFVPGMNRLARTYLNHFAASSNFFLYWGGTRTKARYWLRKKRLDLRKRKIFQNYVRRLPPLYPRMESKPMFPFGWVKGKGTMILNCEELASIYHYPAKVGSSIISSLRPVEARKAGPPADLPIQ